MGCRLVLGMVLVNCSSLTFFRLCGLTLVLFWDWIGEARCDEDLSPSFLSSEVEKTLQFGLI